MPGLEVIQIIAGFVAGGGLVSIFTVRARNTHTLAKAYTILVDDLQRRSHEQANEIQELRGELHRVVALKDQEIATLRAELAAERSESGHLRARVAELEAKVLALSGSPKTAEIAIPQSTEAHINVKTA